MFVKSPSLLWFTQDLRLADHPALTGAAERGPVIPIYVLDDETPGHWRMGGASRWWLHGSLAALAEALAGKGSRLILRRGRASEVLAELAREVDARQVHASWGVEPWMRQAQDDLGSALAKEGRELRLYDGTLLFNPSTLATQDGRPFRVYSPFARAAMALPPPRSPLPVPAQIASPSRWPGSDRLDDWALRPIKPHWTGPDWAAGLRARWQPGEVHAQHRLRSFIQDGLQAYAVKRNDPGIDGTSRLSPSLHFGELSPNACWHAARTGLPKPAAGRAANMSSPGRDKLLKELLWREFCQHLLSQFPDLPTRAFRPEFDAFPWRPDRAMLKAWQQGRTGYPMVDAGMRELWQTGYMHNRVRMIAASFLIKHLLQPWQDGQAWFWDTLVDADLASNAANWQWVAGSGADAAPYFRIFNPVLQGRKFDSSGAYVRRYIPELAALPDDAIHAPFDAPPMVLAAAGVTLGKTYPEPIVEHAPARARALAALAQLKTGQSRER